MSIDRDDRVVKDLRRHFERAGTWPDSRHIGAPLFYKFTMFLADSIGDRDLKLVTLAGSVQDHKASVQALVIADGLFATCSAKLVDLYSNVTGEISEPSSVEFIPWSSIESISRVAHFRNDEVIDEIFDFDVQLENGVVSVRYTDHRNIHASNKVYFELLDYCSKR